MYQILLELKQLYANHAPQLKPRRDIVENRNSADPESESIDPVDDMFNILEGSALIPFIEVCLFKMLLAPTLRLKCVHIRNKCLASVLFVCIFWFYETMLKVPHLKIDCVLGMKFYKLFNIINI